jgi:hypothetical protein
MSPGRVSGVTSPVRVSGVTSPGRVLGSDIFANSLEGSLVRSSISDETLADFIPYRLNDMNVQMLDDLFIRGKSRGGSRGDSQGLVGSQGLSRY